MGEMIGNAPSVDSQEIQFKSIHPRTKNLVFIFCFFSYYFLFHNVVAGNFGLSGFISTIILLIAAGASAYFSSKFVSLNHTTIRLENGSIQIVSENNFLGSYHNLQIPITDIKGYESNDIPFYKQVVIYRTSSPPYIITLADQQILNLSKFLNLFTPIINKANRLSNQSFISAFSKISIVLIITVILQMITLSLFELHSLQTYQHALVINSAVIWKFILVNLAILYIFKNLFYKQGLRIKGKQAGYFIIVLNFILLCAVSSLVERASYKLIRLNKPEEIFNYRKDKTFIVKADIQVDTSIIGYHYTISSGGRRSLNNTLRQYFTSPVNSFQKDWYRLWIGQSYQRKIRKTNSKQANERIRKEFKNENILVFKYRFNDTPEFYEVVYSDFNQSFRVKGYFSSALSSYKSVVPLIVMEPHYENFDEYKKDIFSKIAIFSLLIVASIAIGSSIAAFHR